jgi:hypothetical protein
MGRGISGVIPVVFHFEEGWMNDSKEQFIEHSPDNILDFYDEMKENNKVIYSIKNQILLPHFKDFYFGFHSIIDNQNVLKYSKTFNEDYNAIIKSNDREAFLEHFSDTEEFEPHYETSHGFFSTMFIICDEFLIVYQGSYKAFLEEYRTFYHMERLLVKAFDNPLAKVTKFGEFG